MKKTINPLIFVIGMIILSIFVSCGPSAEEKKEKAERAENNGKTLEELKLEVLYSVDTIHMIACLPTKFDCCMTMTDMMLGIKASMIAFEEKYPMYRITSFEIQERSSTNSYIPIAVWIKFEKRANFAPNDTAFYRSHS